MNALVNDQLGRYVSELQILDSARDVEVVRSLSDRVTFPGKSGERKLPPILAVP